MAVTINVNDSTQRVPSTMTRSSSSGFPAPTLAPEAFAAARVKVRSARRKERITATLCSVALLLSPGLGLATDIDANSFRCITKMTPVRQFYVDNLQGNLGATLAAANSATGAVYPPEPEQDRKRADKPRGGLLRRRVFAIGLLLFVVAAPAAYVYWDNARHFESTDDAFIAARQFAVAPKVSGYITAVPVTDNQHVAGGDVIVRIDDRDYRVALDQAKAQLAHDQAVLEQAQTNLARYQFLAERNAIAKEQRDDQAFLVDQDKATVALDQAKVDEAQLNLSHTTVTAAQVGRVVSLTAAVGQFAQAGTTLTMFVPDEIWVTANFKETQLEAMRPEQPVTLEIDAYPERTVRGRVASVQPGSGPAFSLVPPQNATGNYVKIVQRVPVKIVIDDPPSDIALGPGMSVVPTVRIDAKQSLYERLRAWL